jgi:asparagine synthase (glutamine-hydrolysing)
VAGLADLGLLPFWFVALADRGSAGPLGNALRRHATREVSHPSGRPWLVGRWPKGMLSSGQAGAIKITVIGKHALTSGQLADATGRIRTVADPDRVARSLVGSAHLLASVGGRVRVQGTVTGIRRVFHARVAGTTVAADRADVLVHLLHSGLDEQRLAVHLLEPPILYPLAGQPVWRGVALLPTDRYLVIDGDGEHRSVRWRTPPAPVMPMAAGAAALRQELSAAGKAGPCVGMYSSTGRAW